MIGFLIQGACVRIVENPKNDQYLLAADIQ